MQNAKGYDERFHFVFAADGLPGKTAPVTLNVTTLSARHQSHDLVSTLALAIQEMLEAGGYRHLAESEEDVLVVDIGEQTAWGAGEQ